MQALDNVNVTLQSGRIIGLLGPNGSGKTTLLKIASGLLTPSSGQMLISGLEPGAESKKLVSYLPNKSYFDTWMKVRDCLALFPR